MGPLAVVDLETTGLSDDPEAELLEFGAALLDPGEATLTTLESLVRPRGLLPRAVQRLTGLAPEDVANAPSVQDVAKPVAVALAGRVLIAHNADFERHFLSRFVDPRLADATYLDTQDLLSLTHPDAPDLRLETFTRNMLGSEERHRALSDALDTLRVLARAAAGARDGVSRYAVARNALERFSPESRWSSLFRGGPAFSGDTEPAQYVEVSASKERPVPFDPDAIAEALADEARGQRWFEGYRVREQQVRMAREFASILSDGGRLLLEGGTGVGKSLAYLAAAIPFAIERAAGGVREPVVVSTRTKLLQDQLLTKDIPAAAGMLGYPELRALSIKGRANYVCERRLGETLAEGEEPSIFPEDRLAYAALGACARTRPHGEIGTLPGALLFRFPALRDLRRRAVAARSEQCTREQCAHERGCPFGRRRAALGNAHLVVANHDLLLRWPPDYPNVTHVIADEAHELAGVADEVFALEVSPAELLERFDELFGRSGEDRARSLLPRGRLRALAREPAAWRRGLQQDLVALGRSLAHRASEYGEVQLPAHADRVFAEAAELSERTAERLEIVAAHAERLSEGWSDDDEAVAEAVERAIADLRDAALALRGAFFGGDADAVAGFERLHPPFDRWRLVVRQVAPADLFHERFADRLEVLACVSASLFVGGDSFAALGELELEQGPGRARAERVSVESPFPYAEHMRVVAMEPEGELVDATAAVLAQLTRQLGGRTLGLFTSLRRMRDVAELLAEELRGEGFDVLSPRRATDDPSALVERFSRAGAGGVLLGARTFWQGLDIPGEALQAVVIEKLPFEVPTELRKRRENRLRQMGEDAFERYTLGKMLLNLKQMSGRLIRSEDDRGLVVIVEGRTDRGYFARLGDALPSGCEVRVAGAGALAGLLGEVGVAARDREPG
ncbi:MAG: helicase C-terminal domain-containing protein [Myxococcota bacterium]|nr:helicase C-terminal domain-containing protein [Myxococcota bacterium]